MGNDYMTLQRNAIKSIFDEKEEFLVIGLTGKIASGCTTVSKLIQKNMVEKRLFRQTPGISGFYSDYERECRIIQRFYKHHELKFHVIKVRDIILSFIFEDEDTWKRFMDDIKRFSAEDFSDEKFEEDYLSKVKAKIKDLGLEEKLLTNFKVQTDKLNITKIIEMNHRVFRKQTRALNKNTVGEEAKSQYFQDLLPLFGECLHSTQSLEKVYTELFQAYGNELRFMRTLNPSHNSIPLFDEYFNNSENQKGKKPKVNSDINPIFTLSIRINEVIKAIRPSEDGQKKYKIAVVIDSMKNIHESNYLKNRYSAYYLFSVSREEGERLHKLRKKKSFYSDDDIFALDCNERPNETRKKLKLFCRLFLELLAEDQEKSVKNESVMKHLETIISDDFSPLLETIKNRRYLSTETISLEKNFEEYTINVQENHIKLINENPLWKSMPPDLFRYFIKALRDPVRIFAYCAGLHQIFLQDVETCIQNADIFLKNEQDTPEKPKLNQAIVRYLSLMIHPGLVVPTPVERCMQIAFTAKVNSGCISRQVGAVVTDKDYNILSLGWNDVPLGQIPCIRRNLIDVSYSIDPIAYSDYEKDPSLPFYMHLQELAVDCERVPKILEGLPYCYCFKDFQEEITGEKNAMDSRAMHGEEKALLLCDQQHVKGGFLFTTSSPCVMCAKNAKEHEISKIYYIEPYPGISQSHVCNSGDSHNRAEYILFEGAIGRAYTQLYTPVIPLKDELNLRRVNDLLCIQDQQI